MRTLLPLFLAIATVSALSAEEHRERCGSECFEAARAAALACAEAGGTREECREAVSTDLRACLGEAGCERPERCGADCFRAARESAAACMEVGGSQEECVAAAHEEVRGCLDAAGCEPPERCGAECFENAKTSAMECLEGGGSREECQEAYGAGLKECLDAAGCEIRHPPRRRICGIRCFRAARRAVRACIHEGGTREDCRQIFHDAIMACREEAGCGRDDDGEDDGEAVVAALLAPSAWFLRGDVNSDTTLNISDPVGLLRYLFRDAAPPECTDAADANDDGSLNISDATTILGSLFRGFGLLPAPAEFPGEDPTPDDLDCELAGLSELEDF